MSYDPYDLADNLERLLTRAGYVIYNGNAETGETGEPDRLVLGGCIPKDDWWFTWTQPGCDIEVGEAMPNECAAMSDAMEHFFNNAKIEGHRA